MSAATTMPSAPTIPARPIGRLVIAGGGTGGHVYPGVAIAEEVLRRNPAAKVAFIGTTRGLEGKILPPLGYALETITVSRLKGGSILQKVLGLFRLPRAIFQSWRILRRWQPEVVLGVGGYASGPALLAAWMTFRRCAIQEQNATPGLTNRWLGKLVHKVFLGFAAAAKSFRAKKTVFTGNPIRAAVAARLTDATGAAPGGRDDTKALRVLVFGGSQGAQFLNARVPAALALLAAQHPELALTVTHQTGTADEATTRALYDATPMAGSVTVTPFIHDMPRAYGEVDVAICRAGALTIAELTAVGLPSVLVPFPFAADNHQESNARVLEAAGAAIVATQQAWSDAAVAEALAGLAADRAKLAAMARAAQGSARVGAARTIVDELEGIAKRKAVAA